MSYINYYKKNAVAILVMDRPEKFNSFVREMALDFQKALDDAEADDHVRCILITGHGKAFCAGQDLQEATEDNGISLNKIVSEHYNPIILKLRNIPKPIVAAVNGVAAGAGANIALACDIVVAKQSASFIQAFSKIGLIPDSGGTWILPRLIGFQRATALMMTGEKVSAQQAENMGMIYKAIPDEVFDHEVHQLALQLSEMPTYGLGLTKQALNQSFSNNMAEQLALEDKFQTLAGSSNDYKEGTQAFLEKRKPHFTGK